MKIVAISDTHTKHRELEIPECDLLIHSGDIVFNSNQFTQLRDFNKWLGEVPAKEKVIIAGNHDWDFQLSSEKARACITNAHYLEDSSVELFGLKIWGSPWSPEFGGWAFNANQIELGEKWDLIPKDTDLLITHGPPWGCGDTVGPDFYNPVVKCVGDSQLLHWIEQNQPKYTFHGHIHSGHGLYKVGDTTVVNASSVNEKYEVFYKPIEIEIADD